MVRIEELESGGGTKELSAKIEATATKMNELENGMEEKASKQFVTDSMNDKDQIYRQYVDDMVALAKQERLEGDDKLTAEIHSLPTQEFVNEKDTNMKQYV